MQTRTWAAIGSALAFLGVAAGAFGAHALKTRLEPEMLQVFEVGVRYHLYHSLALVIVGVLAGREDRERRWLDAAAWLFLAGIVLFSGSLYALALSGVKSLGRVTPLGGGAFLLGWASLFRLFFVRGGPQTPE